MKKYHLASYKDGRQDLLHSRRLRTNEGEDIRHIAWYGILHHPAVPPTNYHNPGTFYHFAPWHLQDELESGLLRIDINTSPTQKVTHYLSIDNIGEIVRAPFW